MPRLNNKTAQARVFEALLALTIIAVALTAAKPEPIQPEQPPADPQTLLDYLVYTGEIQYGLQHPQTLTQTLSTITGNTPWTLTVYTCNGTTILKAQNGNPTQTSAAEAILYSPTCLLIVLQTGT